MMQDVFQNFCEKIELDNDIILKIKNIMNKITKCVDDYYETSTAKKRSQFIGSYGRNTAVYVENIRVLVVLPSVLYMQLSLDIGNILLDLKKSLLCEFSACEFGEHGNSIWINIDGDLSFQVIPGFEFDNGVYLYWENNEWKRLNLYNEKAVFNEVNSKYNNNLIHLCRMLKVWKNQHDISISNILLDTFAYHFFNMAVSKSYMYENYDEMVRDFFDFLLPNCIKENFISIDGTTILERKVDIKDKVFTASSKAATAIEVSKHGDYNGALDDWKFIFGHYYM